MAMRALRLSALGSSSRPGSAQDPSATGRDASALQEGSTASGMSMTSPMPSLPESNTLLRCNTNASLQAPRRLGAFLCKHALPFCRKRGNAVQSFAWPSAFTRQRRQGRPPLAGTPIPRYSATRPLGPWRCRPTGSPASRNGVIRGGSERNPIRVAASAEVSDSFESGASGRWDGLRAASSRSRRSMTERSSRG